MPGAVPVGVTKAAFSNLLLEEDFGYEDVPGCTFLADATAKTAAVGCAVSISVDSGGTRALGVVTAVNGDVHTVQVAEKSISCVLRNVQVETTCFHMDVCDFFEDTEKYPRVLHPCHNPGALTLSQWTEQHGAKVKDGETVCKFNHTHAVCKCHATAIHIGSDESEWCSPCVVAACSARVCCQSAPLTNSAHTPCLLPFVRLQAFTSAILFRSAWSRYMVSQRYGKNQRCVVRQRVWRWPVGAFEKNWWY